VASQIKGYVYRSFRYCLAKYEKNYCPFIIDFKMLKVN
jgi:hypothetical protein